MSVGKLIDKAIDLKMKIMDLQNKKGYSSELTKALEAADSAWMFLTKESMK